MNDPVEDWQYVLAFWFGGEGDDAQIASEKSSLWWAKSPDTDKLIWAKFSHRIEQASAGSLLHWLEHPEGRLAAIILIDQFRRNIFRDKAEAFTADELALRWCEEGLAQGDDRSLRPIERVFFYLPLEHAENLGCQQRSVALFEQLFREAASSEQALFHNYLKFAGRHRDIIAQFGRFPHRNAVLGRDPSAEEVEFLKEPGSSF
ncbi:MAG: hypothetical protein ACI89D_001128 [Bermanella sp.]|jgi:uncharacterized protein (DUF924 family)